MTLSQTSGSVSNSNLNWWNYVDFNSTLLGITTTQYDRSQYGFKFAISNICEAETTEDSAIYMRLNGDTLSAGSSNDAGDSGWTTPETSTQKLNTQNEMRYKNKNYYKLKTYKAEIGNVPTTGTSHKMGNIFVEFKRDSDSSNIVEKFGILTFADPIYEWSPLNKNESASAHIFKSLIADNFNKLARATKQQSFTLVIQKSTGS